MHLYLPAYNSSMQNCNSGLNTGASLFISSISTSDNSLGSDRRSEKRLNDGNEDCADMEGGHGRPDGTERGGVAEVKMSNGDDLSSVSPYDAFGEGVETSLPSKVCTAFSPNMSNSGEAAFDNTLDVGEAWSAYKLNGGDLGSSSHAEEIMPWRCLAGRIRNLLFFFSHS